MMEQLAIKIRSSARITGIRYGEVEHKISLYADDGILLISESSHLLPEICEVLQLFSQISFYKINETKFQILGLTVDTAV